MAEEIVLSTWILWGLAGVIMAVFVLPFLVKKVERDLEIFLFVMGFKPIIDTYVVQMSAKGLYGSTSFRLFWI